MQFVIPITLQGEQRTDYDIVLHATTIFLTTLGGVLHMKRMLEPITKKVPLNTT